MEKILLAGGILLKTGSAGAYRLGRRTDHGGLLAGDTHVLPGTGPGKNHEALAAAPCAGRYCSAGWLAQLTGHLLVLTALSMARMLIHVLKNR
jgi:hypothetical protein